MEFSMTFVVLIHTNDFVPFKFDQRHCTVPYR